MSFRISGRVGGGGWAEEIRAWASQRQRTRMGQPRSDWLPGLVSRAKTLKKRDTCLYRGPQGRGKEITAWGRPRGRWSGLAAGSRAPDRPGRKPAPGSACPLCVCPRAAAGAFPRPGGALCYSGSRARPHRLTGGGPQVTSRRGDPSGRKLLQGTLGEDHGHQGVTAPDVGRA